MTGGYYTARVIITVEKDLDRFWARDEADARHLAGIIAKGVEGHTVETEVDVAKRAQVAA